MSRRPKWLGRCPVYETAETGMKYHLVRDMHRGCTTDCPVYDSAASHGRELTPQEFEAWIPYIGHLPQFRPHVPTQYENLIVPEGLDVSSLPTHPLSPPTEPVAPVPTRYDDFFASLKPPSGLKPGVTRIALGDLPQDLSTQQNGTYEDFFDSFLGLRTTNTTTTSGSTTTEANHSQSREPGPSRARVRPPSVVSNKPLSISQSSSNVELRADESQSNANYHVLNFTHSIPANYDDFFAPGKQHAQLPGSAPLVWRIPRIPPPHMPSPPPPPPPPPPPTRDLAAFQRILASTTPQAISAAVLAVYTAVPAAQELFWEHLGNTVTTADGSMRLVARHQVCRHCAEEFDITKPGENCTWHYGATFPLTAHNTNACARFRDPRARAVARPDAA